jgi:enoyl-CoA hydratase/carnithine racemase
MRHMMSASAALAALPQPTIAAVNGPAIGGGFGYALGCDIRVAGPEARFGATFVRMAMGPDAGLSRTLPDAIGYARALELLLTGELVDAAEALHLGIVSRVVPDAREAALELAGRIAAVPGHASRAIKSAVRRANGAGMTTVLDDIESVVQAELICQEDWPANAAAWLSRHNP